MNLLSSYINRPCNIISSARGGAVVARRADNLRVVGLFLLLTTRCIIVLYVLSVRLVTMDRGN